MKVSLPKEYPKRHHSPDLDKLMGICECGHSQYAHEGYYYNNTLEFCKICECPKYNEEKRMTQNEYIEQNYKSLVDGVEEQ